jgi:suppressor of ftsI
LSGLRSGPYVAHMGACIRWSLAVAVLLAGCSAHRPAAAQPAVAVAAPAVGPAAGSLILAGGGRLGPEILERFVLLAGGPEARIVVLPGAGEAATYAQEWSGAELLRAAGATAVHVLHTRDRAVADTDSFTAVLRDATGVWISGGRQWRLTDAYLGTRTLAELHALLERGGVIGGTSAGASVQPSFMVRGAPEGNHIMMAPGYTTGFGFLRNAAVDQHLSQRNRQDHMLEVLERHPELVAFGLDEGTAVVVQGDVAEVIGAGGVAFYHPRDGGGAPYYFLRDGDVFDLARRVTTRRASRCLPAPAGSDLPNHDLYCVDLIPVPDYPAAVGAAQMRPAASPFGVAVDEAGVHRFELEVVAEGLPDPRSLGDYPVLIAWATTPLLRPFVKLGVLDDDGRARGTVAFNQFMVMISAERSADVTERTGPLLLRGTSPSMRLRPADDPVLLLGATDPDDDAAHAHDAHATHDAHAAHMAHGSAALAARGEWVMPPMEPGVQMPPGMMTHRPPAAPFLPADSAGIPEARPRQVMELRDGAHIELTAGPVRRTVNGRTLVMYGYNGQYPGPLLRVAEGTTITVTFRNEIELPGSIHWHGLRLQNAMDGVPGVTQEAVVPGGEFRYTVFFPDAGIYWYHPHVREDITQDLGLYGNMLVDPADAAAYGPAHREEALILDDILLAEEGLVPYGADAATDALMGRFGNVMLVNGRTDWRLDVRQGEIVRLFLTNASNTRTYNVSLPGARMKVVGSDIGRFEREAWIGSVVIAPAERYIVDVLFDRAGAVPLLNRVQAIDHMAGAFLARTDTLGRVLVAGDARAEPDLAGAFGTLRTHDDVVADIDAVRHHFDRPVDHHLVLTMEARGLPRSVELMMRDDSVYFHPVEWHSTMQMMSWIATTRQVTWIARDAATGLHNMDVRWQFRVGDFVRLRITNARDALHAMQHPIHIHGQRFLVIARNGVPTDNLVWKDTVLVPVGQTADLLLELTNPGLWMLHCHIAEHMEAGMMMVFEVTQ